MDQLFELKRLIRDGYAVCLLPSSGCSGYVTVQVTGGGKVVAQVYGSVGFLGDLLNDVYVQTPKVEADDGK